MSETRWVQHVSGQGDKWEVLSEDDAEWNVRTKREYQTAHAYHELPKSEYRLCDAPKQWEDVTGEVRVEVRGAGKNDRSLLVDTGEFIVCRSDTLAKLRCGGSYRLRKIDGMHNGPAFVVERRKA